MTALPQQAARAAQETREQGLRDALEAFWHDVELAQCAMPMNSFALTLDMVETALPAIEACASHLRDMRARLPGSARQGQVRDVAEGDPAYRQEQGR